MKKINKLRKGMAKTCFCLVNFYETKSLVTVNLYHDDYRGWSNHFMTLAIYLIVLSHARTYASFRASFLWWWIHSMRQRLAEKKIMMVSISNFVVSQMLSYVSYQWTLEKKVLVPFQEKQKGERKWMMMNIFIKIMEYFFL